MITILITMQKYRLYSYEANFSPTFFHFYFKKHVFSSFLLLAITLINCNLSKSCARTQAHLGATRPRVGIANLGLDAPSWQYLKYGYLCICKSRHRALTCKCRRGDASPPGEDAPPQLGSSSLLNQQSTGLIKYDVIRFTLLRIEAERLRAIAQTTCST